MFAPELNPIRISLFVDDQTDAVMSNYPSLLTPPMDSPESIQMMILPPNEILSIGTHSKSTFLQDECMMVIDEPYLRLVEEPVDKFRFRYKSEMSGTHGSLTGRNSDKLRKLTYPTVELCNYNAKAIIRCSLYQVKHNENESNEPHAHRLVKKYGNNEMDDPHDYTVCPETGFVVTFYSLGIIHTARKHLCDEIRKKKEKLQIEANARLEGTVRELNRKELLEIKKFAEIESKRINLNIVCLRYDAFEEKNGILHPICRPIYSNAINNLKSALTGELKIARMDHCSSPSRGGQDIFIFVEKVTKKNIKIRFFELSDDGETEVWEDFGKFSDYDVHHQYAIAFKTPPYKELNIDKEVPVYMELYRPSDGARSEPREFKYTPVMVSGRKRARYSTNSYDTELSSSELPATLELCARNKFQVNSEDLEKALQHNDISSAEFQNVCEQLFKQTGTAGINELYAEEIAQLLPSGLQTDGRTTRKSTLNDRELEKVRRQFESFMKTNPSKERIAKMMDSLCSDKYTFLKANTFLHILAADLNDDFLSAVLNVLNTHKIIEHLNMQNAEGMTPLHVAVTNKNLKAVENLSPFADVSIQDLDGNTALHIGINNEASLPIIKHLVQSNSATESFINLENNDGHSALHLAIKARNLLLVKLLIKNGANVNQVHKNNGQTPLHIAVAEQHYDVVNFLLEHSDVVVEQCDFNDTNVLQLAEEFMQDNNAESKQIYDLLEQHMTNSVTVKSEVVDVEVEEDTKDWFKLKHIVFEQSVLETIAPILDKSGNWRKLAEVLDFTHLLKNNLFTGPSPSKCLLEFAVSYGVNVVDIRDDLEDLNETEAVQLMDKMISEQC